MDRCPPSTALPGYQAINKTASSSAMGLEGGGDRSLSSPRLFWLILGCFTLLQSCADHRCTLARVILPGLQNYSSASKPECVSDTWRQASGPAEVEGARGGQPPSSRTAIITFMQVVVVGGGQKEACQSPAN